MGDSLTRVSPTSIPEPDEELKLELTKRGVKFGKIDPDGKSIRKMINVELPKNWGILTEWDRGDIWRGYLIDDKGSCAAYMSWVSKQYEQYCEISSTDEKVDLNKLIYKDGWYSLKNTEKIEKLYDLANSYYRTYIGGYPQKDLDAMYDKLVKFKKDNDIDELKLKRFVQNQSNEGLQGLGKALLNQNNIYVYEKKIPFIK